jgi:hypothetical protein
MKLCTTDKLNLKCGQAKKCKIKYLWLNLKDPKAQLGNFRKSKKRDSPNIEALGFTIPGDELGECHLCFLKERKIMFM